MTKGRKIIPWISHAHDKQKHVDDRDLFNWNLKLGLSSGLLKLSNLTIPNL
jgi:hypothetical protein